MALLYFDGLKTYGGYADANRVDAGPFLSSIYCSTGNISFSERADRFGQQSYQCAIGVSSRAFQWRFEGNEKTTLICGIAFEPNEATLPSYTANEGYNGFYDSIAGDWQLKFHFVGSEIQARRGDGTLLGTTSGAGIAQHVWKYVEYKVTIDNSAGAIEVKIDGVTVLNLSGIDTQNTANNTADHFSIKCGYNDRGFYFQDCYICDDSGASCNDFLGDVRAVPCFVHHAGEYAQLTPSAGDNYQNVDEQPGPDEDTSYNYGSTANLKDAYGLENLPGPAANATILGIKTQITARGTSGTPTIKTLTRAGTTDELGSEKTLSTSYQTYGEILTENPDDAAAWEKADINALEAGAQIASIAAGDVRLSHVVIEVLMEAPTGSESGSAYTVADCDLHLKTDSIVEADGEAISGWIDSGGAGNDLKAYGARRPLFRQSGTLGLNEEATAEADGSDDRLDGNGMLNYSGNAGLTIFVVAECDITAAGTNTMIARDGSGDRGFGFCLQSGYFFIQIAIDASNRAQRTSAFHNPKGMPAIYRTRYNGSTSELSLWCNGIQDDGALDGAVPATIGNDGAPLRVFSSGYNYDFEGHIPELLVFNRALTDEECETIEAELLENYAFYVFEHTDTSPDTNSHQGIAFDGTNNFTIHTNKLYKRNNTDWAEITSNATPFAGIPGVGLQHLCDGAVYDGKLYSVAWDYPTATEDQFLTLYLASDLSLDSYQNIGLARVANAVAVDPDNGWIYTIGTNGATYLELYKYDLSTLAYIETIELDYPKYQPQGLTYKDGLLWVAFGVDATAEGLIALIDPDAETVRPIFRIKWAAGEAEGIDFTQTVFKWMLDDGANEKVYEFDVTPPDTTPQISATPGDTLELIQDSIVALLLETPGAELGDQLEVIQDAIEAELHEGISAPLGDQLEVIQDSIVAELSPGVTAQLGDTLEIIQDNIAFALMDIADVKRWLAPLKIVPQGSTISALYLAAHPIRHPVHYFQPKIKSYGTFTRAISAPVGFIRSGDVSISVIDANNEIRQAIAPKTIRNAEAELRLGPEDGHYSAFFRPWRRRVGTVGQPQDGIIQIPMRDYIFDFLEKNIPNVITEDNFPNLPENPSAEFANLVIGVVASEGGALPCPLVDDTSFYYLACRHIAYSVDGVYRKADDSDEFELVDPSEYSIKTDHYVEHELGSGDYCTLINFNSDQGGKKIRANVSGVMDADGNLALTNFADCIHGMLLYLQWAYNWSDVINLESIDETRSRVDDLACAGAWTKPITFGEALTQLQRSSNIDVFADKYDRITLKYTDDEETPTVNLSDLERLHKASVSQTIADPCFNQLPYQYKPNFAANTWIGDKYDNEADQEYLGKIKDDEMLNLFFVRDATTAAAVVARRAQYLDLDSFRFEGTIPLIPVIDKLELGDIVSIDHFGGIKAGGYAGTQFKILELSQHIDSLTYRFKGIRRRLPPPSMVETYEDNTGNGGNGGSTVGDDGVAVSARQGIDGDTARNARCGPFYNDVEGELFAIFKRPTGFGLMAWFTQNYGVTWLERDQANAPTPTNILSSFDAFKQGDELHVATQESTSGRVAYHVFNMVSKTWTTVDNEVVASTDRISDCTVSIECRNVGLEPVVYFQGDRELVGGIYYHRGWYSILQGGSWSIPVMATPTPNAYLGRPSSHCLITRVCAGRENRMHFYYEVDPADRWVSWSPDIWVQSMDQALSLGGRIGLYVTSISYHAGINIGDIKVFHNREKIIATIKYGYGKPASLAFSEGPNISNLDGKYLSGNVNGEGGAGGDHNPASFLGVDDETDPPTLYSANASWGPGYIVMQQNVNEGGSWESAIKAGPSNSLRASLETLCGNFFKIRSKMYMAYFSTQYGKNYPAYRWLKLEDLPYT